MKIKRTTAYSIVRTGRAENLPRGGSRSSKVDDEIEIFVIEVLGQDPFSLLAPFVGSFLKEKHSVTSHLQDLLAYWGLPRSWHGTLRWNATLKELSAHAFNTQTA